MKTTDPWTKLNEFRKWLQKHPKAAKNLPQSIGETLNMGYGADDPLFQQLVEDFKARYEDS